MEVPPVFVANEYLCFKLLAVRVCHDMVPVTGWLQTRRPLPICIRKNRCASCKAQCKLQAW